MRFGGFIDILSEDAVTYTSNPTKLAFARLSWG